MSSKLYFPELNPKLIGKVPSFFPEPAKDGWYDTNVVNTNALMTATGRFFWHSVKLWTGYSEHMVLIKDNKIVAGMFTKKKKKTPLWMI